MEQPERTPTPGIKSPFNPNDPPDSIWQSFFDLEAQKAEKKQALAAQLTQEALAQDAQAAKAENERALAAQLTQEALARDAKEAKEAREAPAWEAQLVLEAQQAQDAEPALSKASALTSTTLATVAKPLTLFKATCTSDASTCPTSSVALMRAIMRDLYIK